MFRTIICKTYDKASAEYFRKNCAGTKCIRNNTNFIIRNVMTGVNKDASSITDNEKDVLLRVEKAINGYNQIRMDSFNKHKRGKLDKDGKPLQPPEPMTMPEPGKWMLSYGFIDYLFKFEKDPDYYSVTSQVNQQAIRKRMADWQSYFKAKQSYDKNPSLFKGRPELPKYIRDEETVASFTNQVCKKEVIDGRMYLKFTNLDEKIPIGEDNGLPLVRTEVMPCLDGYELHVTFEDKSIASEELEVPEGVSRFYGIDPGIDNFLSVSNNIGKAPFIIDGKAIKAENQWFNKKKAEVVSALTKGKSSTKGARNYTTQKLSEVRDNRFRDWFYRIGHYIFRRAKEDKIDAIVIGHNKDQKQSISIGHVNNQKFVSIPYNKMIFILQVLSREYEIPLIVREESYTSKASSLDGDPIPTYGKSENHTFSGRRVKRGLYKSKDGILINADINGATNILRKEFPYAYDNQDMSYLYQTVERIKLKSSILGQQKKDPKPIHKLRTKKSRNARIKGQAKRHLKIQAKINQTKAAA